MLNFFRKLLIRILPEGQFARNMSVLAGGTAISQGLLILVTPLLARIYTPSDFGVFAVYSSAIAIGLVAIGMQYEAAIPLPKSEEDGLHLLFGACGIVVLFSALVALFVWVFGATLLHLLRLDKLALYWWILPLGLIIGGFQQVLSFWGIRGNAYKVIAFSRVSQNIVQIVLQLLVVPFHLGPIGLMVGDVGGRTAGGLNYATKGLSLQELRGFSFNGRRLFSLFREYYAFPVFGATSAVLITAAITLPATLIVWCFGTVEAGWFALMQRLIGLPLYFIGQAAGQVFLGEATRLIRENPSDLPILYDHTAKKFFTMGVVMIIPLALLSPFLVGYIFGPSWVRAGWLLIILSPTAIGQFVVSPLSQTATILKKQNIELGMSIFRIVLVLCLFVVVHAYKVSFLWTMGLFSLVMTITYMLFFFVYRWIVKQGQSHA